MFAVPEKTEKRIAACVNRSDSHLCDTRTHELACGTRARR
jgi:hypothetical protein